MVESQEKTAKPNNLTPDVLEAASILVAMKRGMRYFLLEAQQARYQLSYLDFSSLNPGSGQLHLFSGHRIPFSPLYDISPMPAAYHFPLAHTQPSLPQPVAYYGMLASPQCFVGPPREQSAASVAVSTEGVGESENIQPVAKKMRLSNVPTSSPEPVVNEKQELKRKRKNLTKDQLEILEAVYAKDKYPHIEERLKLEEPTRLTEDRIQVWFQNRRAKDRKKLEAEKLQRYFENNKIELGSETNDVDAKNASSYNSALAQSPTRKHSNSSTDVSDNDSLSCSGSPTQ